MGILALIFGVIAFISSAIMLSFSAKYDKQKAEYEFIKKELTGINKVRVTYQLRKNESASTELFWRLKYHGAIDNLLNILFKR